MNKTCNTCSHNDCGFCDLKGIRTGNDTYCGKWRENTPEWKQAIMRRFMKVN